MDSYVTRRSLLPGLVAAAALTLGSAQHASAQGGRTLFGSSSGRTSSGVSGSQNQSTLFGSQGSGSTSAGGTTRGGAGGGGTGGMGGTGSIASSTPSLLSNTLQSAAGNLGTGIRTGGGFVGNTGANQSTNRQGTTNNRAGMGNATRNNTQFNTNARRNTGGGFNFGGQGGGRGLNPDLAGGQGGRAGRQNRQVRFTYRMALASTATRTTAAAAQRLSRELSSTRTLAGATGLTAQAEAGVVVLRGRVASEYDRRLAELVAKLEPGVTQVRNELVVAGGSQ